MNDAFEKKFFLPYQRAWIQDTASLRIVEKGRQIGMTTADAYDSVKKALARGGGLDVWVSSRDLPTAREYLRNCKRWAQLLQVAADGPEWEVIDHAKDLGAFTLRFKSGRCIFSLSSNPDALVGKTGHIKLDEFAVHREQAELYRVAKPCTTWGGQLSIISTHRGDQTVFYEILDAIKHDGNPMGWSHHRVTLQDAVDAGLVERINKVRGLKNPPATLSSMPGVQVSADDHLNPPRSFSLTPGVSQFPGDVDANTPSSVSLTPGLRVSADDPVNPPHSVSLTPGFSQVSTDQHARLTPGFSQVSPNHDARQTVSTVYGETREQFVRRLRSECLDEEQWLQEYCCVPADDNAAFITHQMITQCEEESCMQTIQQLAETPNRLYIGVDIARKDHLCVIDVGEKIGDVIWDRMRLELRGATFDQIEDEFYSLMELRQVHRACIDATGLGMQLAERARKKFRTRVEAVTFTAEVKEQLAYGLRTALEQGRVRLDPDPKLRADLRGIRKEVTSGDNFRFGGETKDSHCDRFWAKALRQHATTKPPKLGAAVV